MFTIDLNGKVAIVTGVSSGIGLGIAKFLSKAGCTVVGCSRTKKDDIKVNSFLEITNITGNEIFYQKADVTKTKDLEALTKTTVDKFGKIDILISNAGANVFEGAEKCSLEKWQHNSDLNLKSHWYLSKLCKPYLEKSDNGTIILMGSNHGFTTLSGCFPYNVTKTALTGLVRSLAIEWAPGIRVIGLAPGFIDTSINDSWFNSFEDPKAEREKTINLHPVKKFGTVEELGAYCVFLSSSFTQFTTGVTFLIDGGRSTVMQDN